MNDFTEISNPIIFNLDLSIKALGLYIKLKKPKAFALGSFNIV